MIGLDTNVVVRFLVDDDKAQAARARKLISERDVFVPATVLLETEWVLRSAYEIPKAQVIDALEAFCAIRSVKVGMPAVVRDALGLARNGMDFADALHLCAAVEAGAESFASFDSALTRKAARAPLPVAAP